jgi:hypothetical protein
MYNGILNSSELLYFFTLLMPWNNSSDFRWYSCRLDISGSVLANQW